MAVSTVSLRTHSALRDFAYGTDVAGERVAAAARTPASGDAGREAPSDPWCDPVRDQMVTMVAHDLKDPLSTITMAAEFVLEDLVPADAAHDAARRQLRTILRAANRMGRLVADLLDAAAARASRLEVSVTPTSVEEILAEAHSVLQPLAWAKGVTLRVVAPARLPLIDADSERLLQIFANLGGNAIKFTEPGGCVTIDALFVEQFIQFEVADTGPGIAADELRHVFDHFWRGAARRGQGHGLGLAIVAGIVRAHGGQIDVLSVPGHGSIFRFTIPCAASDGRS